MTERGTSPWIAFLAGAVAMLAIALLLFAWQGRDEAEKAAEAAIRAADTLKVAPPRLPDAPLIPDAPVPRPK